MLLFPASCSGRVSSEVNQGSVLSGVEIKTVRGQSMGGNEDLNAILSPVVSLSRRDFSALPQEGVSDFAMGEQRRPQNALAPNWFLQVIPVQRV